MEHKITNKEEIEEIKGYIWSFFFRVADADDSWHLSNAIFDDVIKDIEETADTDYNDCDIDMAITRVLKKRIGIEG